MPLGNIKRFLNKIGNINEVLPKKEMAPILKSIKLGTELEVIHEGEELTIEDWVGTFQNMEAGESESVDKYSDMKDYMEQTYNIYNSSRVASRANDEWVVLKDFGSEHVHRNDVVSSWYISLNIEEGRGNQSTSSSMKLYNDKTNSLYKLRDGWAKVFEDPKNEHTLLSLNDVIHMEHGDLDKILDWIEENVTSKFDELEYDTVFEEVTLDDVQDYESEDDDEYPEADEDIEDFLRYLENNGGVNVSGSYHGAVSSSGWRIEPDSSLGHYGIEVISPPMEYKKFIQLVPKVIERLKDLGYGATSLCGYHIGVSSDEFNISEVIRDNFYHFRHEGWSSLVSAVLAMGQESKGLFSKGDPNRSTGNWSEDIMSHLRGVHKESTTVDDILYTDKINMKDYINSVFSKSSPTHAKNVSLRKDYVELRSLGGTSGFESLSSLSSLKDIVNIAISQLFQKPKDYSKREVLKIMRPYLDKLLGEDEEDAKVESMLELLKQPDPWENRKIIKLCKKYPKKYLQPVFNYIRKNFQASNVMSFLYWVTNRWDNIDDYEDERVIKNFLQDKLEFIMSNVSSDTPKANLSIFNFLTSNLVVSGKIESQILENLVSYIETARNSWDVADACVVLRNLPIMYKPEGDKIFSDLVGDYSFPIKAKLYLISSDEHGRLEKLGEGRASVLLAEMRRNLEQIHATSVFDYPRDTKAILQRLLSNFDSWNTDILSDILVLSEEFNLQDSIVSLVDSLPNLENALSKLMDIDQSNKERIFAVFFKHYYGGANQDIIEKYKDIFHTDLYKDAIKNPREVASMGPLQVGDMTNYGKIKDMYGTGNSVSYLIDGQIYHHSKVQRI